MISTALLALADGSIFEGRSVGHEGQAAGEVVFNTALTGYQEILTDPSYYGQLVVLTMPHVGNVGANRSDEESTAPAASGVILRNASRLASSWRAEVSLESFFHSRRLVAIAEVDTRRLTRHLRDRGAQNGCILTGPVTDAQRELARNTARALPPMAGCDLTPDVSRPRPVPWTRGVWQPTRGPGVRGPGIPRPGGDAPHLVVYDFGVKRNILGLLVDRGCRVTVVPAATRVEEGLALRPDGVLFSNGPGDPEAMGSAVATARAWLARRVPFFGICLGHQLLGLASGGRTVKMKFGHHGANHPVIELATGRVWITSQNHGFTVDEASLPQTVCVTHRSLFDGTLQGFMRTDVPALGFQGHPEASPGPHDAAGLFDRFLTIVAGSAPAAGSLTAGREGPHAPAD
jgi:carbamoyl-phosphate synthase small subunit